MTRYTLDIETLDTAPTAVVTAIGAVDIDNPSRTYHARLKWQEQPLLWNRTLCPHTISWWLQQSKEAQTELQGDADTIEAIMGLKTFLGKDAIVWTYGSMDEVVLTSLHRSAIQARDDIHLVHYKNWRNARTLSALCPDIKIDKGVAHRSLDDAIWCGELVLACLERLDVPDAC